jgi:release factor glutamine methyltransferase
MCCGSGAICAAIVAKVNSVEAYASDVDEAAVTCARANLGSSARVFRGDLYQPLPDAIRGRVNVLVANVPYVPSDDVRLLPPEARDHEPRSTLDGGPDGLDMLRRVAGEAPRWLARGGSLLIETSEDQAANAAEAFRRSGLVPRTAGDDEVGATVIIGTLN